MDRPRRTPRRSTTAAAPPPAPYLRPQQPADSPAASLPTETLKQILELSLEGLTLGTSQKNRLAFGRVAVHWWSVAEVNKQAVVKSSFKAEKLAQAIRKHGKKSPTTLYLEIEALGAGRGQRAASLLSACRGLEYLELRIVDGSPLGRQDDQLGKPLYEALQSLSSLKTVLLPERIQLTSATFFGLLASWTRLEVLRASELSLSDSGGAAPSAENLPSLTTLRIPLGPSLAHARHLEPLLSASKMYDGAQAFTNDCLEAVIDALKSVETLTIGFSGHDAGTLFGRLCRLPQLKSFRLRQGRRVLRISLSSVTADGVVAFLQQTTTLRSLKLPSSFASKRWSSDDVAKVTAKAVENEVELRFGGDAKA
ncbi:hypothetical protein BCR35DRAFT_303782 [Leucosporidium creatinivorum]|uniref:F-box domain-containing protein n=1 Tax=Leucosporidium creatinivorum TaxID=106004 RepID=A0A1Y2FHT6_9BASI|nr:hypothetical protein BCR35DRAFT_303782 [Leucosporidium creatinivorum]